MTLQTTPYYLPVTRTVVEAFLDESRAPSLPVERAGLLAVMLASSTGGIERGALSRAIADADRMFVSFAVARSGADAEALIQLRAALSQIPRPQLWETLLERGIEFAPDERMAARAWCGPDGRYSDVFQDRCRDTLTEYYMPLADAGSDLGDIEDERAVVESPTRQVIVRGTSDQARVAYALAAAPDEHFELRAYAGSGKTHLALALAAQSRRCVHLAAHKASQEAFVLRTGSTGIQSVTVARFVTDLAAEQIRLGRARLRRPLRLQASTLSLEAQAQFAGLPPVASDPPQRVLAKILQSIRRWCYSDKAALAVEHFDAIAISPVDKPVYVALAQRFWDLMFEANGSGTNQPFTLHTYHLIKWLDLLQANIPSMGTILVDESHELPSPMFALLDRYAEGWVAMGDPYQSVAKRAPQATNARVLTMVQSVRTGRQVIPLIRSVLDLHGEQLVDDVITGSRDHITRHHVYTRQDALPSTGLRVYGTEWQMLEDALRIKEAGGSYWFIPASAHFLRRSVADAIELHKFGVAPKHQFHLSPFRDWPMLAQHLADIGQHRIARLFERGFGLGNLDALFGAAAPGGEEGVTLGLLEHCKNLEFSTVVMSPCCFNPPKNTRNPKKWDALVKAAYVAMTRVRDELWIPGEAIDALVDYVRRSRESHTHHV
ncbi:MAG: hypothetical protein WC617_12150 [Rhodanobacter sp.]|jgi:hypothetical protein